MLAERYRLDQRLGRGGVGEVWSGRDLRLGRDVAVKVMRDADPGDAEIRRFVREATVAAGLQHPGITVVFDADAHDGQLFIVTELLGGQDLGKVLAAHPAGLPLEQVLDFGIQFADALAAAHRRGIIHRDLKPSNLFVQADERVPHGRLKVCDFGFARDLTSSAKVSVTGEVFGTPAYMAPEQWQTSATTPSADLYAIGCILYEMLTGRAPFEGPSLLLFMTQHLTRPPVPPCDVRPGIPRALNDLVVALLAKEAVGRPADAAAVLDTLTHIQDALQRPGRQPLVACASPGPGLLWILAVNASGVLRRRIYDMAAGWSGWEDIFAPAAEVTSLAVCPGGENGITTMIVADGAAFSDIRGAWEPVCLPSGLHVGKKVAASRRGEGFGAPDLFAVDGSGGIWQDWSRDPDGWHIPAPIGKPVTALASVARAAGQVLVAVADGHVFDARWVTESPGRPAMGWADWREIEVTGFPITAVARLMGQRSLRSLRPGCGRRHLAPPGPLAGEHRPG